MPFDATPGLSALSDLLRHPERWPEGFRWDFLNCETCAMGLAKKALGVRASHSLAMAEHFDFPLEVAHEIFCNLYPFNKDDFAPIQPHHIADLIDHYLSHSHLPARTR